MEEIQKIYFEKKSQDKRYPLQNQNLCNIRNNNDIIKIDYTYNLKEKISRNLKSVNLIVISSNQCCE